MNILKNKKGEGYIDTGIKIVIAVVIGALILGGLYLMFTNVIFPNTNTKVESMINSDKPIQIKHESNQLSYSYDGTTWKTVTLPGADAGTVVTGFAEIGSDDNRVWVASTYKAETTRGTVYTSEDGLTWVPINADTTGRISVDKTSTGRVYLNFHDGRQYYTTDGVNWTMTSTKRY